MEPIDIFGDLIEPLEGTDSYDFLISRAEIFIDQMRDVFKNQAITLLYYNLAGEFVNIARKHDAMTCGNLRELPEIKEIHTVMDYLKKRYPDLLGSGE